MLPRLLLLSVFTLLISCPYQTGHAYPGRKRLHHSKRATVASPSEAFLDQIYLNYANGTTQISQEQLVVLFVDLGLLQIAESGEPHDHEHGEPHVHDHDEHHGHAHKRLVRRAEPTDSLVTSCHSPGNVTSLFGLTSGSGISREKFMEMSPALLHMSASKVCANATSAQLVSKPHSQATSSSVGAAWGGAMLANFIVTLVALTGALMVPFLRRNNLSAQCAMHFMMALAVGCLLGDALLHLIPEALGVHSHDHGNEGHNHSETLHDHFRFIWIGSVTILGAYSFFILEKILHHIMAQKSNDSEERSRTGAIKPVVWLVLAGDGLHNFVDGLAIGVAFSRSVADGIQTSLAVLFHEIPHELGDFAVLLSSGLSVPKALLFNCLGNAPAFLGSILALTAVPADSDTSNWILAFTAGNFLYLALVDLLPSLFGHGGHAHSHNHGTCERESVEEKTVTSPLPLEEKESDASGGEGIHRKPTRENWKSALPIHTGVILGWGTMVLIAIYGE